MNKQEFIAALRNGLSGLPQADIEERVEFYSEMIADRMEEGLSEEEAVSAIGEVEEIVGQTVADIPLAKIAKERISPKRRLNAGEILLLVLGSPIWVPLGIAAAMVIAAVYISLWSIVVSLWAGFASLVAGAIGGAVAGAAFAVGGSIASGLALLAAGMVCAGLSVFLFFGCRAATKGMLILPKKTVLWMKNRLMKKEETQ